MATMTVTVTVTGRHAGNTITWSRTATMEDLLGGTHGIGNARAVARAESGNGYVYDPLMYTAGSAPYLSLTSTAIAAFAILHNSPAALMNLTVRNDDAEDVPCGCLPQGLPFFLYNGGAGGFGGGAILTSTDPVYNIEGVTAWTHVGRPKYAFLCGQKLVS